MEREVELEHRAVESSTALARIQVTSSLTVVKLINGMLLQIILKA